MSELLTREEYAALADALAPGANAFIDGAWRPARSGRTFESVNPATGAVLASVAACASEDVDFAAARAREAFDDGRWALRHPSARKAVLIRLAKLMRRERRELAVLESLDAGKTVRDCEEIDVPQAIETILWHAESIDKLYDHVAPSGDDSLALVLREPVGVVAAVLPWNFPLLMLAWKIGPALAAGCSVVVKPAEQTSLTALRVAELAVEAGLPRGVLSVVTGTGPDVGEPLGRHPDVDMVAFTGSTDTGRRFLRYSAESNLKRVVLECGGKNPCIVMDDAEDLDVVAMHVAEGAFWNMGENCSATSRLIVHRAVKDDLLARVVARARDWRTGDPLDPASRLGALVDAEHHAKVTGYVRRGAEAGRVVLGGGANEAPFVEPTIIEGVDPADPFMREEIFGPVLSVVEVGSLDEAVAAANDTEYGLAAALFCADGKRALRAARRLRAGTVTVNSFGEGDVSTPSGGYKSSGFGGRDKSVFAHEQYTELKTVWIDLSDTAPEEQID